MREAGCRKRVNRTGKTVVLLQSVAIVTPIFALVVIGYAAMRTGIVSRAAGEGLAEYVFVLAIPALLFRTVATADLPPVNPSGYWLAYFIPLAICWAIASFVARQLKRDRTEQAIIGFAAAQANTVLIGIPLILGVLGDAGKVPIVLILVIHLPLTMTAVTLMVERGSGAEAGRKLLRSLFTHPILLGIFLGLAWRFSGFEIPAIPFSILRFLADSAAPCALVATGMSLSKVTLTGSRALIATCASLKLVLHPLLVWFLAAKVFALPPHWIGVAIIFAACPTGINAYLVAERYRSAEAVASGAIALSTVLAILTMTLAVATVMALGYR